MESASFNHLPLEIVETILINVPTYCILFNKPWVCKLWTSIVLKSEFWIRKLIRNKIILTEDIKSMLQEFLRNIQVASLYHACLYEEHVSWKMPLQLTNKNPLASGLDYQQLQSGITDFSTKIFKDPPSSRDLGYQWYISGNLEEMLMGCGVLITRSVAHVEVFLVIGKKKLPALPLLLKLLAIRETTVKVNDNFSFWNFTQRLEYMQLLPGQVANVCGLRGCVSSLRGLIGDDAHELQLAIAVDENNVAIDPGISTTEDIITMLHIKAGTDVSNLCKLKKNYILLIVSGLEPIHIPWMAKAAKTFYPNHCHLMLLSYNLNKNYSKELLQSLSKANIEPINILCSSSTINEDDVKELTEFAAEFWPIVNVFGGDFIDLYESNEELKAHRYFDEILCDHD